MAAGFSDGEHSTVKPLAHLCMMLPSRFNHRERLLAHILFYTRKAVSVAHCSLAQANCILQERQGSTRLTSTAQGKMLTLNSLSCSDLAPFIFIPTRAYFSLRNTQPTLRVAYSSSLWPRSATVRQSTVRLLREALHLCVQIPVG